MKFKERFDFSTRINQSNDIMNKYPTRIPIIFESNDKSIPKLKRKKYLVERDFTLGSLMYIIRKHLELSPDIAIYLLIGTKLYPASELLGIIYDDNADNDGFLYINYSGESTFGKIEN